MPNRVNADPAAMDRRTSAAVRDGIGERLRDVLKPSVTDLPPRLQDLMEQLERDDRTDSPSIAPELGAMGLH